MDDKYSNPWQTLHTRIAYENPWIRVRHDEVIRPDGQPGIYGVVHYKNKAIGILPIDDEGYMYLIGQFRYALNRYSWEIPEGGCPESADGVEGEDPLETARRELLEETGLVAREWKLLGTAELSNSVTNELGIYFLATGLVQHEAQPEGTEKLEMRRVPFAAALQMVLTGEITDALSVMAIMRYALLALNQQTDAEL